MALVSLPTELYLEIVFYLTLKAHSRFAQCYRSLYIQLNDHLYRREVEAFGSCGLHWAVVNACPKQNKKKEKELLSFPLGNHNPLTITSGQVPHNPTFLRRLGQPTSTQPHRAITSSSRYSSPSASKHSDTPQVLHTGTDGPRCRDMWLAQK